MKKFYQESITYPERYSRQYVNQIIRLVQGADQHRNLWPIAGLPAYYNLVDIYVLLSRSEGNLPKTILEAMICGRAVIAADIPQNREGARKGDEIIFVDPYDTGEIAAAVNRLLDDAGLRQRLGENARQSVLKYHAPEVIARGMVKVYEEVLYRHHKG